MIDITDIEFDRIRQIMHKRTGVFLKETKKPLVVTRLRKRIEELKLTSFSAYIPLLEKHNSSELEFFINAITTNETYFFRHYKQFEYLENEVLPGLIAEKKKAGANQIRIWSAASSTGEEPYSLAILCSEVSRRNPGTEFKIYASDINSTVLAYAKEGRYPERSLRETPPQYIKKYFSRQEVGDRIKRIEYVIDPLLAKKVEFKQHNLLQPFHMRGIDIVFLRNVMIYFDQPVKEKVVQTIQANVSADGYIFISLSESLNDVDSDFVFVKSGIYRKQQKN